jgi:hypothetical protein
MPGTAPGCAWIGLCFDFHHGTTRWTKLWYDPFDRPAQVPKARFLLAFATPRPCVSSDAAKINAKTPGRSAASRNQSVEPELKICH